ncbi:hypothetical protein [Stenotrophomonas pictorum]|nr:hypothetical protein [Stenotrophomonas pictorum]
MLLLLALVALLLQDTPRRSLASDADSVTSITGAPPAGDEDQLQETRPAKLRRVVKPHAMPAALSGSTGQVLACLNAAVAARSLIPASIMDVARPAPGRRQQRGQAPPQV